MSVSRRMIKENVQVRRENIKTSIKSRDMSVKEDTGKYLVCCSNANATMDLMSYKTGRNKKKDNQSGNESGRGYIEESKRNEIDLVRAWD